MRFRGVVSRGLSRGSLRLGRHNLGARPLLLVGEARLLRSGPLWAILEITNRCQLRCRHCSLPRTGARAELSTEAWKAIIADLHRSGCEHITVSGGEPLLRDDVFDLVDFAKRLGLETSLTSNGLAIDESVASRLRGVGIDGVQISVDGVRADHEALRGPGTFVAALEGIRHLVDVGVCTSTMTVLSRLNSARLDPLLRMLRATGIAYAGFERLTPVGRGASLGQQILKSRELRAVFEALLAPNDRWPEVRINDPLRALARRGMLGAEINDGVAGCLAGIEACAVGSNGGLRACSRLAAVYGDLDGHNLSELWLRTRLENVVARVQMCGGCHLAAQCGGCRAELMPTAGGESPRDPGCWLEEPTSSRGEFES